MADKLLRVLDALLSYEALDLASVTAMTGLSRSATHRILQKLVAGNWVYFLRCDQTYMLLSGITERFQGGARFPSEVATAMAVADGLLDKGSADFRVFINETGRFRLLEASRKSRRIHQPLALLDDPVAVPGFMTFSLPEIVPFVGADLRSMPKTLLTERRIVLFRQRLIEAKALGFARPTPRSFGLPIKLSNRRPCAMLVQSKPGLGEEEMAGLARSLQLRFQAAGL